MFYCFSLQITLHIYSIANFILIYFETSLVKNSKTLNLRTKLIETNNFLEVLSAEKIFKITEISSCCEETSFLSAECE